MPTAKHISQYHNVCGYDISSEKVKAASNYFPASTEWSQVPKSDVYVVCVNTWWRDGKADMSAIEAVCRQISESAKPGALVSIESTVTLGTCRNLFKNIFHEKLNVVNCPHRLWELGTLSSKDMEAYGVNQVRILGAVNEESKETAQFYFDSIEIETRSVSSCEISEICKITENSYRYIEVAFAEELAMICKKYGLLFEEIRNACNTLKREKEGWQVQIMEARSGIGGTCLPKDIEYLFSISNPARLIKGAIETDELYRKMLAGKQ
jgi:UDP-N-acetyl-D-mannosaminuronic acid dehydrogenase